MGGWVVDRKMEEIEAVGLRCWRLWVGGWVGGWALPTCWYLSTQVALIAAPFAAAKGTSMACWERSRGKQYSSTQSCLERVGGWVSEFVHREASNYQKEKKEEAPTHPPTHSTYPMPPHKLHQASAHIRQIHQDLQNTVLVAGVTQVH